MQSGQALRRATVADYDEILSILPSSQYDGDFLPDYFHMLMSSPLYDAVVYVVNGKIIGHSAIFVIDGGTTGVMRCGRIRKEYQEKGILRELGTELLRLHPMVQRSVSATATNIHLIKNKIDSGFFKLLTIRKCIFYSGYKNRISNIVPTIRSNQLTTVLQECDLTKMIREHTSYPHVFEDDGLVIDSVPYKLMESNVPIILMERTRAVVSYLEDKNRTLLTFGSYFRLPNGDMFCKLDIYGTVCKILSTHISLHLQTFWSKIEDRFTIEARFKTFSDIIDHSMHEIGLTNVSVGTTKRTDIYCVEMSNDVPSKL